MAFRTRDLADRRWILSAAIVLLSSYVIYRAVDLSRVLNILAGTELWIYGLAVSLYYFTFPFRGKRWQLLLRNSGIVTRFRDCMETVFISFFLNLVVPAKMGDIYRAHRIRPSEEVSRSRILGTVITCRFIDFVILTLLVTSLGAFVMASRFEFLAEYLFYFYGFLALSVAGFFMLKEELLSYVFSTRLKNIFLKVKEGFKDSMQRHKILITGLSLLTWLLVGSRVFLVFRALNVEAGVAFAFFFAFFMILLSIFPLTPAGLGVVEVISTSLLSLYGYEPSVAASVVLLDRSITVITQIMTGTAYTAVFKRDFLESLELEG